MLVVGLARTGVAAALFCAAYGATSRRRTRGPNRSSRETAGEAARRRRDAGTRRARAGDFSRAGFDRGESRRSGESAGAGAARAHGNSGVERNRTGLAISARASWWRSRARTARPRPLRSSAHILKTAGFRRWLAAISARRCSRAWKRSTRLERYGGRSQQLSAGNDRGVSSGHWRAAESHARPSGPPRIVRGICARAKMRMFENQTERDAAVLNADDPEVTRTHAVPAARLLVQPAEARGAGRFLRDDEIVFRGDGSEDAAAAARATLRCAASTTSKTFWRRCCRGVSRRSRAGGDCGGVKTFAAWSIGSNSWPRSPAWSISTIPRPRTWTPRSRRSKHFPGTLLVILGGKDKGSPYTPLREPLRQRARVALLIGAAAEKIARDLRGAVPIERAGTLERAVEIAMRARASRAIWCCWRRPARVSTSLRITSIAGASSRNWSRELRKHQRGAHATASRKGSRKDNDAAQSATRPADVRRRRWRCA